MLGSVPSEVLMRGTKAEVVLLISALLCLYHGIAAAQIQSAQEVPAEAKARTVVDMSQAELVRLYHKDLSHLEFAQRQDELPELLKKVGERVNTFFRDFSNTSAKENVVMQVSGSSRRFAEKVSNFNYLILPRTGRSGPSFEEYRTDKKNRPADRMNELDGAFMISSGYAAACLYLHPSHQANSEFRYLGREAKSPRAHVIAFAQKVEDREYLARYIELGSSKVIQYLVQGFIWVMPAYASSAPDIARADKSREEDWDGYQIMRIRTSMRVLEETILKEQITDVAYKRVQFENTRQQFWLPEEVKVSWIFRDSTYRNTHKYSDYHMFGVESDYKIGQPKID